MEDDTVADELKIKLEAFTLDCKQPLELAHFYAELLGWVVPFHDEEYAVAGPAGTSLGAYPGLTFQRNDEYVPPQWPAQPGVQQQMAHLDFAVNDLDKAVAHALRCGAAVADTQFTSEWTVMLDPAGHPFCLCLMKQIFDNPDFGLK